MLTCDTPIARLGRIQKNYFPKLKRLGIATVGDLLFHLPFRYDDYAQISAIRDLGEDTSATIIATIRETKTQRTWKRRIYVTEALLEDGTGSIRAVWFNQPYLENQLTEGTTIRLSGKVSRDKKGLYFAHPTFERATREPTNTGRLVPVYPETEGITSRWLRWQIGLALKTGVHCEDPLPRETLAKLHLPPLAHALRDIHFPKNENVFAVARKRFAFEEMFLMQLFSLRIKKLSHGATAAAIPFDEKLIQRFVRALPFRLTDAQRKASFQILTDMAKNHPMNRLLNGDVGSGKTIVATLATLETTAAGFQVALLAPTEVLARQHFETLHKFLSPHGITVALLTSSYKKTMPQKDTPKATLVRDIGAGRVNVVIGTHALLQEHVRFKNLALVIVDEQHRFGVAQRAYLQQKVSLAEDGMPRTVPHFLTMSATPIPRTLALAFFGDLDLSVLDELPKDRKPIITRIVPPTDRNTVYAFVRSEIKKGRQTYVILPLVEESKALAEVKAAVAEYKRLATTIFPDLTIGLLHGRLSAKEKENMMQQFKEGAVQILVATAVVEVGIDVPNATIMIIEDADRFGLSQLHQFRGRIGRGQQQSYCFLFAKNRSNPRLKVLAKHTDGFAIAEEDLKQRGPGEFFGTRQSGLPDIAMENITNVKLVTIAREEAASLLAVDPALSKHPLLRNTLAQFEEKIHLE